MAGMAYGIPDLLTRAVEEIVEKMGLPSNVKDGLKKRLASVQIVRLTGEGKAAMYPTHLVTHHRDTLAFPEGGVLSVYVQSSSPGVLRVITFKGIEQTQPEFYVRMHENSAYFMGQNLFSRHCAAYEHAAETMLDTGDGAYVLLYRFSDEDECSKLA